MSRITASYEVRAGTASDLELDTTNMDPDQIARYLEGHAPDVSLCHQCDDNVIDPEVGDLAGFPFDGRHFERDDESGRWVESR